MEDHEEERQKLSKKLGMRHVHSLLLFLGFVVATGVRSPMSIAIIPMTDIQSGNPNSPVFDWDTKIKSYILSSVCWGAIITQVPIGYYINKNGARKFVCFNYLLFGLLNICIPLIASYVGWIGVFCCRILIGMSQGSIIPCFTYLIAHWAPPSEKAFLSSFVFNGMSFGSVLFSMISGTLAESKYGWQSVFYIPGIFSIAWSIIYYSVGADSPSQHPRISANEARYINDSLGKADKSIEKQNLKIPWSAIIRSLPLWSLLAIVCGQGWCISLFYAELPSYLTYVFKLDIGKSGEIFSLSCLATWLMGFPFMWLSHYALRKNVSPTLVCKFFCTLATWGPALTLTILCFVKPKNDYVKISLIIIAFGLYAGTICSNEINCIDLSPNFAGILVSIMNTAMDICGLISPIACGYIVTDMTDESQWNIIFGSMIVIYFITNLIFLIFGKAVRQSWDSQAVSQLPLNEN